MEVIKIKEKRSIGYEIKVIDNMISRQIISLKHKCPLHITPVQVRILSYINEQNQKEIYQKDLENIFNMRRSTVSGILKNMEKNNLIKRIDSPKDARIKQIILTDYSKDISKHMKIKREEFDKKLEQNIKEKDLEIFYKVIDQIKENIEK